MLEWYVTCKDSLRLSRGCHVERNSSSGVMAVMVVALVAILVVFLLVSGVFAPQGGGGIDIKLP